MASTISMQVDGEWVSLGKAGSATVEISEYRKVPVLVNGVPMLIRANELPRPKMPTIASPAAVGCQAGQVS